VNAFWDATLTLLKAVIASVSVGFLFLLVFLGGLAEWLRGPAGRLPSRPLGAR
jgi:hypothetical protein